ncbi:MAG: quinolinate synthase NadA [Candidatus Aminicenantes bacterium]|nr:quinolinate synthase NadA [Candidatus Aminicenantes bacterium]
MKDEIIDRIKKLKSERNAILLAHNYQIGEIQDIADILGDSLELSQKAAKVEEEIIVFCGVRFMAETAAILAPDKTVLLPDDTAGCPMADMITAPELIAWKRKYPGRKVVGYVNTTAEVKAECDICCTSANAIRVVESIPGDEILFVPDRNLAHYVSRNTKKKIIAWDGYCYVHNNFSSRDVLKKKQEFPEAELWVHPESPPDVIELADEVYSTGQMVKNAKITSAKEIIIGTEEGMIYRLEKENPKKIFYPLRKASICHNMKKITLDKVLRSLENRQYRVVVPPDVAARARGAIEKMVQL